MARNPVWSDEENDALVAAYFAMLSEEMAGRDYVKAEHRRALEARIGRSKASVEWKHMNLSHALDLVGLPTIEGYRPAPNIQRSLADAVERFLDARPEWQRLGVAPPPVTAAGLAEAGAVWTDAPGVAPPVGPGPVPPLVMADAVPDLRAPAAPPEPALERLAGKFDPVERDHRNRDLGARGEAMVVAFERERLIRAGEHRLADKVRQISLEDDGAGFDVLSFDPGGRERWLEVKTTAGGARTPFYVTRNELAVGDRRPDAWRVARVYDVARRPRLFELGPPLGERVNLQPEVWRAGWG